MGSRLPDWPLTRAPLLDEFKRAMQARSKAIRYRTSAWSCERGVDDDGDGGGIEYLTVRFEGGTGSLTLRLWSDGLLFVNRRRMRAQQVAFELSFDARLAGRTCAELVAAMEESFERQEKDALLQAWAAFQPGAIQTRP